MWLCVIQAGDEATGQKENQSEKGGVLGCQ